MIFLFFFLLKKNMEVQTQIPYISPMEDPHQIEFISFEEEIPPNVSRTQYFHLRGDFTNRSTARWFQFLFC